MGHRGPVRRVDQSGLPGAAGSIKVLLLASQLRSISRVQSAIRAVAAKLTRTSTINEALISLRGEHFDLVIVDRHLGGWLSPQACKALVAAAEPIPVVGLIDEDCVLDLHDGIEARLRGVYYKDQIDVHLMRRLSQLADPPSLGTSLHGAFGATV